MRLLIVLLAAFQFGCTAMMLGGGQSAGRPIGTDGRSTTAVVSDQRITAIIRNRYVADDELSEQRISIVTVQGVVTLRGSVDSYPLRDRAVRLAADVPGVTRVTNQIAISR